MAEGDQLAIVEVMKLMNPVLAPEAGEIVLVCAVNADLAVEYDQILFWIRPLEPCRLARAWFADSKDLNGNQ